MMHRSLFALPLLLCATPCRHLHSFRKIRMSAN